MKTLRRLAFLALFGLAATATAGPPASNAPAANAPVRNAPRTFTADQLGELLNGEFTGVEATGEGKDKTYSSPKLPYKLSSGDQTVNWSVQFNLMSRGVRSPVVRIFFPCQKLPAKTNADRLAKLLNQNGGGSDSPAYFMVGGKDADWLYIVGEVTTEGLTGGILKEEVTDLFKFAERTMPLWGDDLTKPPAKSEGKKNGLTGAWRMTRLLDKNVGVVGLTLSDDGQGEVDVYEVSNAPPIGKPGKYTLKGDELTLTTKGGTVFTFTVKQKGDELTVSYKEDGETVTRTLTRKK